MNFMRMVEDYICQCEFVRGSLLFSHWGNGRLTCVFLKYSLSNLKKEQKIHSLISKFKTQSELLKYKMSFLTSDCSVIVILFSAIQ